jgi:tRNA/tmRNA/rRNA uracil-C5-methylase (TrmA/RlmC/RlmD family)
VHYPPGAFGQNNLDIAQQIIEHVRDQVPQGARVAEFYAGVGAIGLSVLAKAGELRLNEVSPQSLHGLELGLGELDSTDRARITVFPGEAGAAASACSGADGAQVVIADPPRKGLDPELTVYLGEQPPERFVYISCGLESFLDDTAKLTARGKLKLAGLTAFNLMPFTDHVEIVARFEPAR